jgi:hypothetical protein
MADNSARTIQAKRLTAGRNMQAVPAMAEMDQDWWAREVEVPMMLLVQRKAILRALLCRRFSSKTPQPRKSSFLAASPPKQVFRPAMITAAPRLARSGLILGLGLGGQVDGARWTGSVR